MAIFNRFMIFAPLSKFNIDNLLHVDAKNKRTHRIKAFGIKNGLNKTNMHTAKCYVDFTKDKVAVF